MGWNDYPLRSLTIPQDSTGADAHRVIGGPTPPELLAGLPDYTWHFTDVSYFPDQSFYWEALVTNTVFGTVQQMTGICVAGVVTIYEIHEDSATPSIKVGSGFYNADRIAYMLRKTDLLIDTDATLNVVDPVLDDGTTPETSHALTLASGWTGALTVELVASPRNCVFISGTVTPGTKADATTIANIPAALAFYRPSGSRDVLVSCDKTISAGQPPHLNLQPTGAITCWGLASAVTLSVAAHYRL